MNIGIGISLANYRPVPTVPLDPDAAIAALFGSGEVGAWYDPSDSSTVWQDAAGTTPATVGDPVGRIDDKSGNGNHATQTTSAARPVLQQSGGLYYLDFDGVDDSMTTGAFAAGNQAQPNTIALAVKTTSTDRYLFDSPTATARNAAFITGSGAGVQQFAGTGLNASVSSLASESVLTFHYNTVSSSFRQNGSLITTGNAGSYSWSGVELARRYSDANWLDGRIYSFVGVNRTLTAAEITDLETYLAAKSGVTL